MNMDMARTFLEIVACGNFLKAAERLAVTPSTVSMRMKALEDDLGQKLFVRNKGGTDLTAAGRQFQRYAASMVRTWRQARQEIALPAEIGAVFSIGGEYSLWDSILLDWLSWLRRAMPEFALRSEVGEPGPLIQEMTQGMLDVAVLYAAQPRPGLVAEQLFNEKLVLVSREAREHAEPDPLYVFADWGPEFRDMHGLTHPADQTPAVTFGFAPLALRYVLDNGGSGYFPQTIVGPLIDDGWLHLVTNAPEFTRPVYLVYPYAATRKDWFMTALEGLKALASADEAGAAPAPAPEAVTGEGNEAGETDET